MSGMLVGQHVLSCSPHLFPLVVICPACDGRELVGDGETEWVCHGRVVRMVMHRGEQRSDDIWRFWVKVGPSAP